MATTTTETADFRTTELKAGNTTTTTKGRLTKTTLRKTDTAPGRVVAGPRPAVEVAPCRGQWEETADEVHILPAEEDPIRAPVAVALVVVVGLTL